MLKMGMCVVCVKLLIHQTPPRSKGRRSLVTRSNEIEHKTSNICPKRHRILEIYPSYRK